MGQNTAKNLAHRELRPRAQCSSPEDCQPVLEAAGCCVAVPVSWPWEAPAPPGTLCCLGPGRWWELGGITPGLSGKGRQGGRQPLL